MLVDAPLQATEADLGDVANPLEGGDRHAAGVEVGVGDHRDAQFVEDLVGAEGDRSVGCLGDHVGPDRRGVLDRDLSLESGGKSAPLEPPNGTSTSAHV